MLRPCRLEARNGEANLMIANQQNHGATRVAKDNHEFLY